ncbi:MAG: hypothetical protein V3S66_02095 [Desulfobacterales bacterium]
MLDLIKKSLLTGIGLALKTKDEVEDLARDLSKKSKMTEKEGRKFIDDLNKRYEESRQKLDKNVEAAVKKMLKKADLVTADQLKALQKEIRELKKAVSGSTPKPQS